MGESRCSPTILDLGTRWRWIVSFTPQPLYPQGNSPIRIRWEDEGGPIAGLDPVEWKNLLFLPGLELAIPRPSSPYPIAVPTELSQNLQKSSSSSSSSSLLLLYCCFMVFTAVNGCHNPEQVFLLFLLFLLLLLQPITNFRPVEY
jgi:hypothetical protein